MNRVKEQSAKAAGLNLKDRFRLNLTTRGAIGFSVLLHLMAAAAIAMFYSGAVMVQSPESPESIEFELVPDMELAVNASKAQLAADAGINNTDEAGGRHSMAQQAEQRRAVITASLASLSGLRESFKFITQSISADTLRGMAVLQGNGPSTRTLGSGYSDGAGFGPGRGGGISITVSGGGVCAVPTGR